MKFSRVALVALLGFSSSISAAPVASDSSLMVLETRAATPISVITSTLNTLNQTLAIYEQTLNATLVTVGNSVSASIIIAAAINADLKKIADALKNATAAIAAATNGAVIGTIGTVGGLVQADIDALAADLITLQNIVKGLSASITVTATNLTPAAQALILSEVALVSAALAPLLTPIRDFATALTKAQVTGNVIVNGVTNALVGVNSILNSLLGTVGLPGVPAGGLFSGLAAFLALLGIH